MLLHVTGLTKRFGSVTAADNIDFTVAPGEAVGIVGPNGAGKTSLFNLIAGGWAPDAGSIRLDGRDITGTRTHERCIAGIARSYQIPQPFESLTVFENLLVGAVHGQRRVERDVVQDCGKILEQTRLQGRANTLAGEITLLDRKRLEMARAIATGARLLLLDEVAGGLTESECADLVGTIKDIRATGVAIIWIEHIVYALLAVVDRLIVLNFGRKIAEGHPQTVMDSPDVRQIYIGIET